MLRTSIRLSSRRMSYSLSASTASQTPAVLRSLLSRKNLKTQFVFVGGKGGVGKTSTSSAVAIKLSDAGYRTLLVSTDPAHSLGDALDIFLPSGNITPVTTEQNLWALEIDVEQALEGFKDTAKGLDTESLSSSFGVPKEILDSFGLNDIVNLFSNPPPGIDEVVSLIKIFEYADQLTPDGRPRFDRIVIDTAPTGHTIRLLQLPNFLNSLTGNLIKFRTKVTSAIATFKNMFGGNNEPANPSSSVLDKIEVIQNKLQKMQLTLKDPTLTQFVVVSIPTALSVAESTRLVTSLSQENIQLSSLICNQVVSDIASKSYMDTRRRSQRVCLDSLKAAKAVDIELTEVPYFDTEVTGIYGLRFFASIAHKPIPKTATNPILSRKLTIFGGKGGVGKTTSAASWAVQLADSGMRTLVISTDPAHSLGDALQENLSGQPRLLDSTAGGGQLWAMEVDPEASLLEFQEIAKEAMGDLEGSEKSGSSRGMAGGLGLPDMKGDIMDMLTGFKDPPPGTDEVVALTKVVALLEDGLTLPDGRNIRFDRVVLDTAPTGHTLRMLTLPAFLRDFISKIKLIRDRVNVLGGMTGGNRATANSNTSTPPTTDRLNVFEDRMKRLEQLIVSPKDTEFTVVTIPTDVAISETKRLLTSLSEQNILVRRLIANQVIPSTGMTGSEISEEDKLKSSDTYLNRMRDGQRRAIIELKNLADRNSVPLIQVPYYEMETKTVYGLRAIGNAIFPDVK